MIILDERELVVRMPPGHVIRRPDPPKVLFKVPLGVDPFVSLGEMLTAIGELVDQHVGCDRDCGPLARGVRELLGTEPARPGQPGTDIPAGAAFGCVDGR